MNLNILTVTLVSGALLAGCATTEKTRSDSAKDAVVDVANAPVETLNLKKVDIPEYLQEMDDPYVELSASVTCDEIKIDVNKLSEFLGVDVDDPNYKVDNDLSAGTLAKALIPYGGVIRFFSGATKHEKDVVAALRTGTARRAYLKSKGEQLECAYPAAPYNE